MHTKDGRPGNLTIRTALPGELEWINRRYAEINFLPSAADDFQAVAEIDGRPAGLGRVVPAGARAGELGGMVVFDGFRGTGLSKKIIAFLAAAQDFDCLYCLPFAKLESLYAGFGFRRLADTSGVPDTVLEKYRWCAQFYAEPVILMGRAAGVTTA